MRQQNPWSWIPTLYVAEGLPNVIVMTVAVVMYMQLGMSDTDIALYTSWLGLPWVIKPFWSPFVDLYKTKRWWVLAMQALLGSSLAGVAFTLNASFWLQGTMCFFFLMAFSSATHDIAADGYYMLELSEHQQALYVGIRNLFYRLALIFGNGVLIPIAGTLQLVFRNQEAFTWSLVFYGLAGLFLALWLYHAYIMPNKEGLAKSEQPSDASLTDAEQVSELPSDDIPADDVQLSGIGSQLATALASFFTKFPVKDTVFAMLFLLFYRFPEAMLTKMSATFLIRPNSEGGLGLSPQEFGLANGTIGLAGLMLGGILGGILASRDGLKRWLWPLVCAITLPDIVYVYMSYTMPSNVWFISIFLFIEQFGYGLGFTALTLYMLYFSMGQYKTSHYAICTGISYLGLLLPGMLSGYLKDTMGYRAFFMMVMGLCLITFIVTSLIRIDPEFGKKKAATDSQE
jgi:PAT family beta-lactamase induction signal transducer AmpG